MNLSLFARTTLRMVTWFTVLLLYTPLIVVALLSFNKKNSVAWPPDLFTLKWWRAAYEASAPRHAFMNSVKVALAATAIALVLGTLAAFALHRFRFFGRGAVSFLLVLPIALPGIVSAIAFQTTFQRSGLGFGFHSIVIAHATFCIVVAYNNVIARLRRLSPNINEASADLGASGFQTFRLVTLPQVWSSLVAGALLAFALSFDEIVVTTFTAPANIKTLPQWIYENYSKTQVVTIVTVTATVVRLMSVPIGSLTQRLADGAESLGRA